jgi:SAM-dependent methyltransferase
MVEQHPADPEAAVDTTDTGLGLRLARLASRLLGISEGDALGRLHRELASPGAGIADAWARANPRTAEEIRRFYGETDSYIFALAADHCRKERNRVWGVIAGRIARLGPALHVLAYGDGIGTDSLALARMGHRVTYFDLPGFTSRFAHERFAESDCGDRIAFLTEQESIPRDEFDAAICVEVLEHLPDPLETMARLLQYVRVGGRVLLTESFGSIGPEFPSHLPSNVAFAGVTCRVMEGLGAVSTFYNTDPINCPMEFMRVRRGRMTDLLRVYYRARRAIDTRLRRFTSRSGGVYRGSSRG